MHEPNGEWHPLSRRHELVICLAVVAVRRLDQRASAGQPLVDVDETNLLAVAVRDNLARRHDLARSSVDDLHGDPPSCGSCCPCCDPKARVHHAHSSTKSTRPRIFSWPPESTVA